MNKLEVIVKKFFPLGYKDHFKRVLITAIPIIIGNLSEVLIGLSSVLFVGHIGADELDGVSLANSLISTCAIVNAYGLSSACDTFFPQLFGAKNKARIGLILQKALVIGLLSTLVSMSLLLNSRNILLVVAESPNIAILADQYVLIFLPTTIFYTIAVILTKYLQAQVFIILLIIRNTSNETLNKKFFHRTIKNIVNIITVINFLVIILNCCLHALFIFQFGWGIRGAAIAVDISAFTQVSLMLLYIYKKKIYVDTWRGWSIECLYEWKMYLKLAIPAVFTLLVEISNFEIGSFASATISKTELGLMSIAQNYIYIFFQFSYGIGIAANIIVGQYLGANCPQEAKNAAKVSLTLNMMSCSIIACLSLALSNFLPGVFTNDTEIFKLAINVCKVVALIHLFDGTQGANAGILRAVGAQFYNSIYMLVGFYFIGTPIGLSLLLKTNLKAYGYFIGIIIGAIVLIVLQVIYITRIDWTKAANEAHESSKAMPDEEEFNNTSIINPNFSNKNENKEMSEIKIIDGIDLPDQNSQKDMRRQDTIKMNLIFKLKALKNFSILKKFIVLIAFLLILFLSAFFHDFKKV